jgi:DNA helicase-2/ATP-dependent DNA helicase PcrA
LLRALEEFPTITNFLEHVSLVADNDKETNNSQVNIMTLHAAKGLEFEAVFLPGWEEGLFPHQRSLDEEGDAGLEEERRLAYVGITRAKRFAFITHTKSRRMYNQWQQCRPSPFIAELPAGFCDFGLKDSGFRNPALLDTSTNARNAFGFQSITSPHAALIAKTTSTDKTADSQWAIGKKVFHDKFGNGFVQRVHDDVIEVFFTKAGVKKVAKSFLQLL